MWGTVKAKVVRQERAGVFEEQTKFGGAGVWWGRWEGNSIKEGCVSLDQKFGFYFNCNGQSFGGFK